MRPEDIEKATEEDCIAEVCQRLADAREEVIELKEKLTNTREEAKEAEEEVAKTTKRANAEINRLLKRIEALTSESDDMRSGLNTLASEKISADSELAVLKKAKDDIERQFEALKAENDDLLTSACDATITIQSHAAESMQQQQLTTAGSQRNLTGLTAPSPQHHQLVEAPTGNLTASNFLMYLRSELRRLHGVIGDTVHENQLLQRANEALQESLETSNAESRQKLEEAHGKVTAFNQLTFALRVVLSLPPSQQLDDSTAIAIAVQARLSRLTSLEAEVQSLQRQVEEARKANDLLQEKCIASEKTLKESQNALVEERSRLAAASTALRSERTSVRRAFRDIELLHAASTKQQRDQMADSIPGASRSMLLFPPLSSSMSQGSGESPLGSAHSTPRNADRKGGDHRRRDSHLPQVGSEVEVATDYSADMYDIDLHGVGGGVDMGSVARSTPTADRGSSNRTPLSPTAHSREAVEFVREQLQQTQQMSTALRQALVDSEERCQQLGQKLRESGQFESTVAQCCALLNISHTVPPAYNANLTSSDFGGFETTMISLSQTERSNQLVSRLREMTLEIEAARAEKELVSRELKGALLKEIAMNREKQLASTTGGVGAMNRSHSVEGMLVRRKSLSTKPKPAPLSPVEGTRVFDQQPTPIREILEQDAAAGGRHDTTPPQVVGYPAMTNVPAHRQPGQPSALAETDSSPPHLHATVTPYNIPSAPPPAATATLVPFQTPQPGGATAATAVPQLDLTGVRRADDSAGDHYDPHHVNNASMVSDASTCLSSNRDGDTDSHLNSPRPSMRRRRSLEPKRKPQALVYPSEATSAPLSAKMRVSSFHRRAQRHGLNPSELPGSPDRGALPTVTGIAHPDMPPTALPPSATTPEGPISITPPEEPLLEDMEIVVEGPTPIRGGGKKERMAPRRILPARLTEVQEADLQEGEEEDEAEVEMLSKSAAVFDLPLEATIKLAHTMELEEEDIEAATQEACVAEVCLRLQDAREEIEELKRALNDSMNSKMTDHQARDELEALRHEHNNILEVLSQHQLRRRTQSAGSLTSFRQQSTASSAAGGTTTMTSTAEVGEQVDLSAQHQDDEELQSAAKTFPPPKQPTLLHPAEDTTEPLPAEDLTAPYTFPLTTAPLESSVSDVSDVDDTQAVASSAAAITTERPRVESVSIAVGGTTAAETSSAENQTEKHLMRTSSAIIIRKELDELTKALEAALQELAKTSALLAEKERALATVQDDAERAVAVNEEKHRHEIEEATSKAATLATKLAELEDTVATERPVAAAVASELAELKEVAESDRLASAAAASELAELKEVAESDRAAVASELAELKEVAESDRAAVASELAELKEVAESDRLASAEVAAELAELKDAMEADRSAAAAVAAELAELKDSIVAERRMLNDMVPFSPADYEHEMKLREAAEAAVAATAAHDEEEDTISEPGLEGGEMDRSNVEDTVVDHHHHHAAAAAATSESAPIPTVEKEDLARRLANYVSHREDQKQRLESRVAELEGAAANVEAQVDWSRRGVQTFESEQRRDRIVSWAEQLALIRVLESHSKAHTDEISHAMSYLAPDGVLDSFSLFPSASTASRSPSPQYSDHHRYGDTSSTEQAGSSPRHRLHPDQHHHLGDTSSREGSVVSATTDSNAAPSPLEGTHSFVPLSALGTGRTDLVSTPSGTAPPRQTMMGDAAAAGGRGTDRFPHADPASRYRYAASSSQPRPTLSTAARHVAREREQTRQVLAQISHLLSHSLSHGDAAPTTMDAAPPAGSPSSVLHLIHNLVGEVARLRQDARDAATKDSSIAECASDLNTKVMALYTLYTNATGRSPPLYPEHTFGLEGVAAMQSSAQSSRASSPLLGERPTGSSSSATALRPQASGIAGGPSVTPVLDELLGGPTADGDDGAVSSPVRGLTQHSPSYRSLERPHHHQQVATAHAGNTVTSTTAITPIAGVATSLEMVKEMSNGMEYFITALDDAFRAKGALASVLKELAPTEYRRHAATSYITSPTFDPSASASDMAAAASHRLMRGASATAFGSSRSLPDSRGKDFTSVGTAAADVLRSFHQRSVDLTIQLQDALEGKGRMEAKYTKLKERHGRDTSAVNQRIQSMKTAVQEKVIADTNCEAHLRAVETSLDHMVNDSRKHQEDALKVHQQVEDMKYRVRQKVRDDDQVEEGASMLGDALAAAGLPPSASAGRRRPSDPVVQWLDDSSYLRGGEYTGGGGGDAAGSRQSSRSPIQPTATTPLTSSSGSRPFGSTLPSYTDPLPAPRSTVRPAVPSPSSFRHVAHSNVAPAEGMPQFSPSGSSPPPGDVPHRMTSQFSPAGIVRTPNVNTSANSTTNEEAAARRTPHAGPLYHHRHAR